MTERAPDERRYALLAFASAVACVLHLSGVVDLSPLNPLYISGCHAPKKIDVAPASVPADLEATLSLVNPEGQLAKSALIERGHVVVVAPKTQVETRLVEEVFVGTRYAAREIVLGSPDGSLRRVSFDDIGTIKVLGDTRIAKGAGIGAGVGGALGLLILVAPGGDGGKAQLGDILSLCFAGVAVVAGTSVGVVGGVATRAPRHYLVGGGDWRIEETAAGEAMPVVPVEQTDAVEAVPVVPEPAEAPAPLPVPQEL
jgi:hypothetical protein